MKKKLLIHAIIIAIVIPAIGSTVCQAQFKPVKSKPVITRHTAPLKVDTSKLKSGQAPVRPKQTNPVEMQVMHNNIFRVQPLKPGSAPLQPVKGGNKAHAPVYQQVKKDSTHGFGMVHPGVIFPTSSKTRKGSRSSINPQPLPPKARTSVRNKAAQRMINPQPLPPGSKTHIRNKASQRMINPQPLPPKARTHIRNKAAQRMINPQPLPPKAKQKTIKH